MKWAAVVALLLLSTVALISRSNGKATGQDTAATDKARGQVLYAEHCASCHGASLEGQPDWQTPGEDGVLPAPPHDRTGHTWHHGDAMLFDYTKLGGSEMLKRMGVTGVTSGMPGFADSLTDQEIRGILAFIKASWPERERELQRRRSLAEQSKGN